MQKSLSNKNYLRQINWPEKLAFSSFLSYTALVLIPGVLWRIPNKWFVLIILVMISIISILFDKDMPKQAFLIAMIRYSCAGILALYYGWINRGSSFDWLFYLSKGLLAWYPIVFACYLIQKRSTRMRAVIKYALLLFITFTCATTLISIREFPMASRWLSSGMYDSESAIRLSLSRMNIASYSFTYMLVLLTPVMAGIIRLNSDRRIKVMYICILILFGTAILFTQFLIAIYMVILCFGIILFSSFLEYIFHRNKTQLQLFVSMMCVLPIVFVMFIVMIKPINVGLNYVFTSLNLGTLSERVESLSAQDKNIDNIDSLDTSISDSDDYSVEAPSKDYLLSTSSEDPLTNRVDVYLRPIMTIQNNWLTGNLFSHNVDTSQHSDVIDAVTGGGLLGGIVVICLFIFMLSGLYQGKQNNELKPYTKLSFLMCLGLVTINTIFFSREILLVCIIMPIVGDAYLTKTPLISTNES